MPLAAFFALLLISSPVYARWGTEEDASSVVDSRLDVIINKDASYEYILDETTEIRKDSARGSKGIVRINYNSRAGTFELLEAETINGEHHYIVDRKTVEHKPLASRGEGFDQMSQVLIAFPEVELGSKVHIKYKRTIKEVPIPGIFSLSFFPSGDYERLSQVKIVSEIPLYFTKHDPEKQLSVKKSSQDDKTVLLIDQKSPVYRVPFDEEESLLSFDSLPWIQVSSVENWAEMGKPILNKYEKVLSAPLPSLFERILKKARKESTDIDRINKVTSELATAVHYMGDWRPVNGGNVPRELKEIARTRFGDCKDFSISTVAILRKLGMTAYAAWVYRGETPEQEPYVLPMDSHFNHAIAWVKSGDQEYWIDPTNLGSFAHGVFEDIIDRPALVLDPNLPVLKHIPAAMPDSSQVNSLLSLRLGGQEVHVDGHLLMGGRAAAPWAGAGLNVSAETLQHGLVKYFSGSSDRILKWKFKKFDFKSRIVKDFSLQFEYDEVASGFKTSAGPAWYLQAPGVARNFLLNVENRVSDIFLGRPFEGKREFVLRDISRVGDFSLDCDIDSAWLKATREVKEVEGGVKITDTTQLKKSVLTISDMKTAKFQKLQGELRKCFSGVAVVYKLQKSLK